MPAPFVAKHFDVPLTLTGANYRLEMLSPAVVEIDYDAVTSSKQRLRSVFAQSTTWPSDDMTLTDNREDLIRHEKEFQAREAFAYTVLSLDKQTCLGCVYINPPTVKEYDCEVYLWVRDSHQHLDMDLHQHVTEWLNHTWPFSQPVFPGRTTSWAEWITKKEKKNT